ncbi:MAG: hypothetical protein KF851_12885 [Pirellulaceae bacterium]|nr:hypothetical protein [Pirellulaceae bacterium]
MSRIKTYRGRIGVVLLTVLLAGCAQPLPTLERPEAYSVSVSGVVTLNGDPLADAHILFIPVVFAHRHRTKVPVAFAKTDSEGKYSLSYRIDDGIRSGAHLGRYTVLVSKLDTPGRPTDAAPTEWGFPFEFDLIKSPRRTPSPSQELVPVRYNLESQLTAEITSTAETTLDFHFEK